jgi:hypothetical protein
LQAELEAASLRRAHAMLAAQGLVRLLEVLPLLASTALLQPARAGEAWRAPLCLPWLAVYGAATVAYGHVRLVLLREAGCVAVCWLDAFWRFPFAAVFGGLGASAVLPPRVPPGVPGAVAGTAAPWIASAVVTALCAASVAIAASSFVLYWAARALHRVVHLGECGGLEGVWGVARSSCAGGGGGGGGGGGRHRRPLSGGGGGGEF